MMTNEQATAQHTPEPWGPIMGPSPGIKRGIDDGGDFAIEHSQLEPGMVMAETYRKVGAETYFPAEANARRIVACVNACAGLSTKELEGHLLLGFDSNTELRADLTKLETERDELLGALLSIPPDERSAQAQAAMTKIAEAKP